MSDPIKGPGTEPLQGIDTTEVQATGQAQPLATDFSQALADTAATNTQAAELEPLESVVHDVAARLHNGQIASPAEALTEVVDGLLDQRFGTLPDRTRARMKKDVRGAMLDDPFFVMEVESLIQQALDAL